MNQLEIFSFAWLKMISDNQIAGFINQPYLKSSRVIQRDFSHADINWRKITGDLKICS